MERKRLPRFLSNSFSREFHAGFLLAAGETMVKLKGDDLEGQSSSERPMCQSEATQILDDSPYNDHH
jgi:hypothetical protein